MAEKLDTHYLIRASHDRKINKSAIHSDTSGENAMGLHEQTGHCR